MPTGRSAEFRIVAQSRTGDEAALTLEVPGDLVFFEGHFEGNPMLPGVAQVLALVDARARSVFSEVLARRGARRMSRLKFQSTIRPGDTLELTLSLVHADEPQVRFAIARAGTSAASGALTYSRSLSSP